MNKSQLIEFIKCLPDDTEFNSLECMDIIKENDLMPTLLKHDLSFSKQSEYVQNKITLKWRFKKPLVAVPQHDDTKSPQ